MKSALDTTIRMVYRCGLLLLVLLICNAPATAGQEVRIGVLALRGETEALKTWTATARYLEQAIPGHTFRIIPYDFKTIMPATQRGEHDFVITNSAIYVELEAYYGVTRIATLERLMPGRTATMFGGVIFCRSDRTDINSLEDIRGKQFIAVEENSFGGWYMAWREFYNRQIDPRRQFKSLSFAKTHDKVVLDVLEGRADAGSVRSGMLEAMADEGTIRLSQFKIINDQRHDAFSLLHSTRLYPEWPVARLRHTSEDLSRRVTIALLTMQPDDQAARAAKIRGWTTPLDYTSVHELFKELQLGPYRDGGAITLGKVFGKYRYPIVMGIGAVLLLALITLVTLRFNKRLNLANSELEQANRTLKATQSQLLQQDKMASIGQLAAGVAHEINNPTGFILSNLSTLQKYLNRFREFISLQQQALSSLPETETAAVAEARKRLKIEYLQDDAITLVHECTDGAERIKSIVQDLKSFSHSNGTELVRADLNAGIESTINIVWNELKYKADLKKELHELPLVLCNPGQINQVLLNLLVNAAQAIETHGEITIKTWAAHDSVYIAVSDTGTGIPPEIVDRLFEPFFTTKEVGKGTGLGLSIAYDIVSKHHGEIKVQSQPGKGTTFTVRLPADNHDFQE